MGNTKGLKWYTGVITDIKDNNICTIQYDIGFSVTGNANVLSYLKIEIILIDKIILMLTTIQLWIYSIFKFIMEKLGRYRIINDRIDSKPYLEILYFCEIELGFHLIYLYINFYNLIQMTFMIIQGFYLNSYISGILGMDQEGRYWREPLSVRWQNSNLCIELNYIINIIIAGRYLFLVILIVNGGFKHPLMD